MIFQSCLNFFFLFCDFFSLYGVLKCLLFFFLIKLTGEEEVKVDESLFQELDDLELQDEEISD